MPRRPVLAAGLALAVTGVAGPAYAAWQSNGSGTAKATATALGAATAGSAGNATTTSLDLSWTAPSSPAPTGYAITRDGTPISCDFAAANLGTAKCRDTFASSTSARTFTYVVTPRLGGRWTGTAVTFTGAPVATTPLAIAMAGSSSYRNNATSWDATVTVTATSGGSAVNGVAVAGTWSAAGGSGSCTTSGNGTKAGQCTVTYASIPSSTTSVTFTVTSTTSSGTTYTTTYSPSNPFTVNR